MRLNMSTQMLEYFKTFGAAEIVEFSITVPLNLLASRNAELFFSRHFRRQSVAVPPEAAFDLFAVHCLKTGDRILNV